MFEDSKQFLKAKNFNLAGKLQVVSLLQNIQTSCTFLKTLPCIYTYMYVATYIAMDYCT